MSLENKTAEQIKNIKTRRERWRKAWQETETLRVIGVLATTGVLLTSYAVSQISESWKKLGHYESQARKSPESLEWIDNQVVSYNGTNYEFKIGTNGIPYFGRTINE